MTAHELLTYLQELQDHGTDLRALAINYRHDMDSDVVPVRWVAEDLYDASTNRVLESIVFGTEED